MFSRSVSEATKRKGIIDILAEATEFEFLPVRPGEDSILHQLGQEFKLDLGKGRIKPTAKAKVLLYAHFNRAPLTIDLQSDQRFVLENVLRVVQALVDVISTAANLKQTILAMEVSQMVVQATTANASPLLQLPHFTPHICERLQKEADVQEIFELVDMEEETRENILGHGKGGENITESQMQDIAKAANRYPAVQLSYTVKNGGELETGGECKLGITLERDMDEDEMVSDPVYAPFFPKEKEESWWVLVGEVGSNQVLGIKRISFTKRVMNVNLSFAVGEVSGLRKFALYLMCDSYQGLDQEQAIKLNVADAM